MIAGLNTKARLGLPRSSKEAQHWLNALNAHWAGVGLLALVNLYLLVMMAVLWRQANSASPEALAQQRFALQTAQASARPLQGLDDKLRTAYQQANVFYEERLPVSYSELATQEGLLKDKNHVRLAGVNYAQKPVAEFASLKEADQELTEVTMDARLSGEYRGLVEFLNGLERDKVFFLVDGVTLTGQETGRVNLRVKLTTYLRGLSSDEEAERYSTPVIASDAMQNEADALSKRAGNR